MSAFKSSIVFGVEDTYDTPPTTPPRSQKQLAPNSVQRSQVVFGTEENPDAPKFAGPRRQKAFAYAPVDNVKHGINHFLTNHRPVKKYAADDPVGIYKKRNEGSDIFGAPAEVASPKSSPKSLAGIFEQSSKVQTSPSRSGKKQHEVSSIVFGDEQVPSSSITGSHRQRNPNANASSIVFDDSARQEASPKPSKKQFPHNPNNNDTSKLLHPPGAPPRQAPTPKKNKEHLWTTQSLGNFLNTETITRSPGQGGGKKIFASPPAAGKGLGSMSDLGGPLNEASPTREKKRIDPASVETIAGVRL